MTFCNNHLSPQKGKAWSANIWIKNNNFKFYINPHVAFVEKLIAS